MTLQELVVRISTDITNYSKGIDDAISKGRSAESAFGSIGKTLSAALTVPLAGIGAISMKAASDLKEASNIIRVGTGAIGENLAGLNESFKTVFATVPDSARTTAEAIAGIATRLGLTGVPLESLSTQMLNLARVTKSEIGPLVAATTRVFGDWSIATEKQSGALDFLFKVSQGTGIQITRLSELVVQFGAPMRALGLSFEQGAVLLGRFEKEGVNIETVMPGLRRELGNFAKAGIDAATGFGTIIDRIKNAKTESEGLTIALKVFGQRAATDMFRAIKEGRFDIDELTAAFKRSSETINKAEDDTRTLSEEIKIAGHEINLALAPVGGVMRIAMKDLFEILKPLVGKVGELGKSFAALPEQTQKTVVGIGAVAAAAGPAALGIQGLIKAYQPFATLGGNIASGFSALATSIGNITFAVRNNLTGALTGAEAVMLRFAAASLTVGGALLAWQQLKTIGADVAQLVPSIKELGIVWEGMKSVAAASFGPVSALSSVFPQIKDAARSCGEAISNFVISALDKLGDFDWGRLKTEGVGALGALNTAARDAKDLKEFFTGEYAAMDKAVDDTFKGLRATTAAGTRVSEGALRTAAAGRGISTENAGSVATTAGAGLGSLLGDAKSQVLSIQQLADAQSNLNAEVTKAREVLAQAREQYDGTAKSAGVLRAAEEQLKKALDAAAGSMRSKIESAADLIKKQQFLNAEVERADKVVRDLEAAERSGADVTMALARAKTELARAQEAANVQGNDAKLVLGQLQREQQAAVEAARGALGAYTIALQEFGSESAVVGRAQENLASKLKAAGTAAKDIIGEAIREMGGFVTEIINGSDVVQQVVLPGAGRAIQSLQSLFNTFLNGAKAAVDTVGSSMASMMQTVGNASQKVEVLTTSLGPAAAAASDYWRTNIAGGRDANLEFNAMERVTSYIPENLNRATEAAHGFRSELHNVYDIMQGIGLKGWEIVEAFGEFAVKAGRITGILGTFNLDEFNVINTGEYSPTSGAQRIRIEPKPEPGPSWQEYIDAAYERSTAEGDRAARYAERFGGYKDIHAATGAPAQAATPATPTGNPEQDAWNEQLLAMITSSAPFEQIAAFAAKIGAFVTKSINEPDTLVVQLTRMNGVLDNFITRIPYLGTALGNVVLDAGDVVADTLRSVGASVSASVSGISDAVSSVAGAVVGAAEAVVGNTQWIADLVTPQVSAPIQPVYATGGSWIADMPIRESKQIIVQNNVFRSPEDADYLVSVIQDRL